MRPSWVDKRIQGAVRVIRHEWDAERLLSDAKVSRIESEGEVCLDQDKNAPADQMQQDKVGALSRIMKPHLPEKQRSFELPASVEGALAGHRKGPARSRRHRTPPSETGGRKEREERKVVQALGVQKERGRGGQRRAGRPGGRLCQQRRDAVIRPGGLMAGHGHLKPSICPVTGAGGACRARVRLMGPPRTLPRRNREGSSRPAHSVMPLN